MAKAKSHSYDSSFLACGVALALVCGICFGVFRYWVGFIVVIHAAAGGALVPWILAGTTAGKRTLGHHPGLKLAVLFSLVLTAAFIAGEVIGIGLAQPWFNPLGLLSRILDGDTTEFMFGIANTGSVARKVAMGVDGGFWVLLNFLDMFFMFFFFWIMPWIFGEGLAKAELNQEEGTTQ